MDIKFNLLTKKILNQYSTFHIFRYIIGSETARAFGSWHWALRVTPVLALVAVILLLFIEEPERGQSEGTHNMEATSYWEDVKDICKNRSFMLTTAGFTCVAFVAGALSWFGPKVMYLGLKLHAGNENIELSE
jgi:MFS transporter, Spinster family, sphingosine-1-phosphate transporter